MTLWTNYLTSEVFFVDIDGIRTRVVRTPGPTGTRPILALHGRGGHLEGFNRNIAALSTHSTVIAFDLLGHGLTAHSGSSYDIREITAHAANAVNKLDDGHGFDVVAQSLGAWVAMLVAIENPTLLGRMVLIEPAGLQRHTDRLDDPRVRKAAQAGGQAFDDPTEENVRLRFAQLLHDPRSCDDEMVELRRRLYSLPGATAVHKSVRTADNDDFVVDADHFAQITHPVLFVRGEYGHLPADLLEQLAASVDGSSLVTIADAKQWPHYEQPNHVNFHTLRHFER